MRYSNVFAEVFYRGKVVRILDDGSLFYEDSYLGKLKTPLESTVREVIIYQIKKFFRGFYA